MKSFRIIFIILTVTLVSLCYVHSEIETIKLGYRVKNNQAKLIHLLDQNRVLMYNVSNLRSPSSLEKSLLAKRSDYYMPKDTIIVKAFDNKSKNSMLVKTPTAKKGFLSFLEPKETAEAQEK